MDERQLAGLREVHEAWVEESRSRDAPFGEPTVDGRPRFDAAPEQTAEAPALRRVNNPSEIDDAYVEAMRDSAMTDMVTSLIGPEPNRSTEPRGLHICVYSAADALPIARNPMPNRNEGIIVRGRPTRRARLTEATIELPEQPVRAPFEVPASSGIHRDGAQGAAGRVEHFVRGLGLAPPGSPGD